MPVALTGQFSNSLRKTQPRLGVTGVADLLRGHEAGLALTGLKMNSGLNEGATLESILQCIVLRTLYMCVRD
jgi:hypothetical protein